MILDQTKSYNFKASLSSSYNLSVIFGSSSVFNVCFVTAKPHRVTLILYFCSANLNIFVKFFYVLTFFHLKITLPPFFVYVFAAYSGFSLFIIINSENGIITMG